MRKFIHFMFWPASRVKNDKVRHALYGLTILINAYRFTKSYEEAHRKAQRRAELAILRNEVMDHRTQLHMAIVNAAIDNDAVTYGDADAQWLRDNGIDV
jgi:hypothetical protein